MQIPKLDENANNWIPWKYRMSAVLRGMDGIMDIVEGIVRKPERTAVGGGDGDAAAANALYEKRLKEYCTQESIALLLITNNISDETLDKVIRFTNPKDVWDELHRIFDGSTDDRLYETCIEFFQYKKMDTENISTHISKIKNIWHKLHLELAKNE